MRESDRAREFDLPGDAEILRAQIHHWVEGRSRNRHRLVAPDGATVAAAPGKSTRLRGRQQMGV